MARFLLISTHDECCLPKDIGWPDGTEIEIVEIENAGKVLSEQNFDGVFFPRDVGQRRGLGLFESEAVLDQLPDGVALLDSSAKILRANQQLLKWFGSASLNQNIYEAMGNPKFIMPDECAIETCLSGQRQATSLLYTGELYFRLNAVPLLTPYPLDENRIVVTLRDVTRQTLQRQKLKALHDAGKALTDFTPEEIFEMDFKSRVEFLKENIIHFTKDLLNFDVVEIRLLDIDTNALQPLLSVGINSEASKRALFAESTGNGVTGFVVSTGESYLCEDTTNDPRYVDGLVGAKSSLTVPLRYHDQVIGSFNVESPETNAFTEKDLEFVESFAEDIAIALNTLELLSAQKTDSAQQSVEAIHSAVALPIDQILNDTVVVMEALPKHDDEVGRRLRSILKNVRDIRQVIQEVGKSLAPVEAVPAGVHVDQRPVLVGRRILVVDADQKVRESAHQLLDRYGCIVETAHEGSQALMMVRNCDSYDAVISDIRLPDIDGYGMLVELKRLVNDPPLILMTAFGYDPGHSIVKARREGLRSGSILYKPFKLNQLIEVVESVIRQFQSI